MTENPFYKRQSPHTSLIPVRIGCAWEYQYITNQRFHQSSVSSAMHITLIYIIWLRIQADDACQRGSEFSPSAVPPKPFRSAGWGRGWH